MPDLRRHPLVAPLAAAALCQGLVLLLVRPPLPTPAATTAGAAPRGNDTAELLSLSRRVAAPTRPALGLNNLLSLPLPPPPPPPSELGLPPAPPAATAASGPQRPNRVPPAPLCRSAQPGPVAATAPPPANLPSSPAAVLELARAVAEGAPRAIANDGATQAMAAVQRRQWWLDPAQQRLLQRAWDQAETTPTPESWGELPTGLQVRRVSAARLGGLAGGDVRGRSLVSRQHLTLLWSEGEELWLLRLPLG